MLVQGAAGLDLLSTPALVGLAHVGGGLDGGNELESQVSETSETDDGASDVAEHVAVEEKTANEDVDWGGRTLASGAICGNVEKKESLTNTATQEGEQERTVAVDVVGDVRHELQASDNCITSIRPCDLSRISRIRGGRDLDKPRPKIIT